MRPWTEEEINFIKANYATLSQDVIMEALPNRTLASIKRAADRYKVIRKRKSWTKAELKLLEES